LDAHEDVSDNIDTGGMAKHGRRNFTEIISATFLLSSPYKISDQLKNASEWIPLKNK
jgi:hypothetical protein